MRKPGDKVPGVGPKDARIITIGEAPGKQEDYEGRPFVGGSGNLMKKWWAEAGINKYKVRIENMHEFRPPQGNNIDSVPIEVLYESIQDLHRRITKLKNPYVIVPTGNYPTFALTGKGKVKAALRKMLGEDLTLTEAEKKAGITVLRGSTYIYTDLRGREIKVIPTIHPAAVMRTQKWEKRVKRDWRIVEEESHKKGYEFPRRTHIAKPIQFELDKFLQQVESATADDRLAIDIETWGNTLSCVGFAFSPHCSMTLPLVTKEEKEFYMPYVLYLCGCKVPKVLQNGLFDWYWLDHYGVKLNNYIYDTMAMHHCLDPVESHDLAFLASYFTRQNYWKDEAKDADEIKKYANNMSALWEYNGLDCCLTRELCDILEQKLDSQGSRLFYYRHYTEMYEPLLRVMRYGVRVNVKEQKVWAKRLVEQAQVLREELAKVAGEDLWAKKAFSKIKLHRFLYETLKCPRQKKTYFRKEGKVRDDSIDEVALKRLTIRYPKKIKDYGLKILKVRSLLKKASVLKKGWDKDERIRCTYKLTTEQGRLSSSKNPMGRGYNLQNIEREEGGIRTTFLPDEGWIFVRVDLSQSEDRFCKMYTQDKDMIEQANLRPSEWDSHTENAKIIFKTNEITKTLRHLGKIAVHASQRFMQGSTLSDNLLKMDVIKTPKQCQQMINSYLAGVPAIERNYFPFVKRNVIGGGVLGNSWGRMIDYSAMFVSQELFRKGASFYLQSENVDLLNQLGFKYIFNYIKSNNLASRLQMQVHDECILSCPREEAYEITEKLVKSLETPRKVMGSWISIPACPTVGMSWDSGDCFEWNYLPEEEEFNVKIEEML